MSVILDAMGMLAEFEAMEESLKKGITPIAATGVSETQFAHLCAALLKRRKAKGLILTPSGVEARAVLEDMRQFLGDDKVCMFPTKDYIFYNIEAGGMEIIHDRLSALAKMQEAVGEFAIIAPIEAALQYTVPPDVFNEYSLDFSNGKIVEPSGLPEKLVLMGYQRGDIVEGKGQFSVRGGILDVFPPNSDAPFRIEFFDNEVDTVRKFDPLTQLTVGSVPHAKVICCREAVYSTQMAVEIADYLKNVAQKAVDDDIRKYALQDSESFTQHHYFPSIDKYIPLIYKELNTLISYFKKDNNNQTMLFLDQPSRIEEAAGSTEHTIGGAISNIVEKGLLSSVKGAYILDVHAFSKMLDGMTVVGVGAISAHSTLCRIKQQFSIGARSLSAYQGNMSMLLQDIRFWLNKKSKIFALTGTKIKGESFARALNDEGITAKYVENIDAMPEQGNIFVTSGSILRGFEYPQAGLVFLSEREMFKGGRARHKRKGTTMPGVKIKSYADLSPGDYVVHHVHGIGQYLGLHRLEIDGIIKDFIKIAYQGTDVLYIPASQLDSINKYVGAEERTLKLNKMGGGDFAKVKNRVKKSVEEIAKRLVELYAARQTVEGFPFSKDTDWQSQFEDTFLYDETEDQLRCIQEMKQDMESSQPMDRLLCGDVGFGKTEVALRGAFKAVMDSKQVAYLCPTTILAQQHYNTFIQRMKDFPVNIEMLSRFRTPANQREILKKVKSGQVDIIIGTHKLLQKDIVYKNPGLLIIDEEQRFGVAHKERIKEMKKDIDVLTLTATPIPRTLHMALMGIRDMSVIANPPEDRYPVQTFVMEYDKNIIRDAILKELSRNGQVYYVFNRVQGIHKIASELGKLIPQARIAVAHGQMSERQLEDIMIDTMNGEIDVLICTTIIETGLDIPNVNTIIIENADNFGLAQLYQLRGRVGRANRMAYAYLTYRQGKAIGEAAVKRLQAIREFTEFGSGFKIAMRDLEIRGAGNVLGSEQHGAMDAVGYDMYCRLLEDAVLEAKGEEAPVKTDASVDLAVDAFIPEKYIESPLVRIEIYRRIASIENQEDAEDALSELIDRFGEPSQSVVNLVDIAVIKAYAASCGIKEVKQMGDRVFMSFDTSASINMEAVNALVKGYKGTVLLSAGHRSGLSCRLTPAEAKNPCRNIKIILHSFKELNVAIK